MKNVWRKLRDNWLDFWEDDELDMGKKHLSQHDKRSLLYGGFMIGAVTFAFISISIMIGNVWTSHRNQKDMEEFLKTVVTYMATATDDEYEEIAQTIRHDLVYSQYGQDIENLIRYIPNTADGCCLERGFPERINLVFLNTGEAYGLEIFDETEPIENQLQGGIDVHADIGGGDEIEVPPTQAQHQQAGGQGGDRPAEGTPLLLRADCPGQIVPRPLLERFVGVDRVKGGLDPLLGHGWSPPSSVSFSLCRARVRSV